MGRVTWAANVKQVEVCNPICIFVGVLKTVLLLIKWPTMFINCDSKVWLC